MNEQDLKELQGLVEELPPDAEMRIIYDPDADTKVGFAIWRFKIQVQADKHIGSTGDTLREAAYHARQGLHLHLYRPEPPPRLPGRTQQEPSE